MIFRVTVKKTDYDEEQTFDITLAAFHLLVQAGSVMLGHDLAKVEKNQVIIERIKE